LPLGEARGREGGREGGKEKGREGREETCDKIRCGNFDRINVEDGWDKERNEKEL
jgi:hypothetical protein